MHMFIPEGANILNNFRCAKILIFKVVLKHLMVYCAVSGDVYWDNTGRIYQTLQRCNIDRTHLKFRP